MLTIYGEGRGFRVIWLMEEMGLPYKLRQVDLLAENAATRYLLQRSRRSEQVLA